MPEPDWDVFISYDRDDDGVVGRIVEALTSAGLRVFRDTTLRPFTPISPDVMDALFRTRVVLVYYSASYPTRMACQQELATAYLAAQAEGDPTARILVVNPEDTYTHIEPVHLRDALAAGRPVTRAALEQLAETVRIRAETITVPLGRFVRAQPPWLTPSQHYPPERFTGRWHDLLRLHSALHPMVGRLTGPVRAPVTVLYGIAGIGKTALAAAYVRHFGSAFPRGVAWSDGKNAVRLADGAGLWVIDNVAGDPDRIRALLPSDPDVPCLLITRDPRLVTLGTGLELLDLGDHDIQVPAALRVAASGATDLLLWLAASMTAGFDSARGAVNSLHRGTSQLIQPTIKRLRPELEQLTGAEWTALRVFAAAAPTFVSPLLVADVLAADLGTTREDEFRTAQAAVTGLVSKGLLRNSPHGESFELPQAFVLTVRAVDSDPTEAERVRAQTLRVIRKHAPAERQVILTRPLRDDLNVAERDAAHRVLNELTTRVPFQPLADDHGLLRDALTSLHELFKRTRSIRDAMPSQALRDSTTTRPGLRTVTNRLLEEILRPLLSRWHPALDEHFDLRPGNVGRRTHERAWEHHDQLRAELEHLRPELQEVAEELALISGSPKPRPT
ncbi:toll/interleukin-1 receptor domain-containing protein [Amycolatopsis sp. EV170708-02-1]|uniref:toll/interleukin-1 receptor domain-containing protein n=1 Tax=Amycolatopsis sp. EV170708-02-1 TaxID=2919322 RepID=UPI001F0BCB3D|nr:toll/interleukin-1 receptor domain-containing protein [Amycolatopsis sp. EV170708-02-1]UMP02757.1 toll/interleukin-1 receptor domain-containing protein [Amycolatopsis sp. EV170708-02-1]